MDGSFGIIFSQNRSKVLLIKRRDIPIWVLPGGGIENDETPEDAVIREVFEETGYRVNIIKRIGKYYYPKNKKNNFTFECKIDSGKKTLSNESKAIEEFELENLPEMISPHIPIYIEDVLKENEEIIVRELYVYSLSFWLKGLLHPWALFKYLLTRIGIHWDT